MKKLRVAALLAGGLAVGAIGYVWAQGLGFLVPSLQGNELITIQDFQPNGQPSPLVNVVTANTVRNTTGYAISTATTTTVTGTLAANRYIFTAAPSAVTLNLPANPPDGQMLEIVNGGAAFTGTGVTVATTDGSTLVGTASTAALGAGSSVEWQYTTTGGNKWYRLR
jgi:hypothetical protein